ncbi:MAG: hypothetical protein OXM61_17285 [Candidatus Poribacteria bacterium]|nr:hypothetical protein [Candidatus Poribacteria bacterium]
MAHHRERFDSVALDAKNELQDYLLFNVGTSATETADLMKKVDAVFGEIRTFADNYTDTERAKENREIALDRQLQEAAKRTPFRAVFHIIERNCKFHVYRRNLEKDEPIPHKRGNFGELLGTYKERYQASDCVYDSARNCSEHTCFG